VYAGGSQPKRNVAKKVVEYGLQLYKRHGLENIVIPYVSMNLNQQIPQRVVQKIVNQRIKILGIKKSKCQVRVVKAG
jgi:hypothetical protein